MRVSILVALFIGSLPLRVITQEPFGVHRQSDLERRRTPAVERDSPTLSIRQVEGWTVHVSDRLSAKQPEATNRSLSLLKVQLIDIQSHVPSAAVARLKEVHLWFNPAYPDGRPPTAEYHPDAAWLRENNRDPAMAKGVEFTNTSNYEREFRRMPMFVLHELAHAFHDQVLGFDQPEILAAYEKAKASGAYDSVKQSTGDEVLDHQLAYAMTDAREYFSETSEAYFGRNDFQPFDRAELIQMDPTMCELLERLWNAR